MSPPPAFRFLALIVGGWVGLRVLAWLPIGSAADGTDAADILNSSSAPTTVAEGKSQSEPDREPVVQASSASVLQNASSASPPATDALDTRPTRGTATASRTTLLATVSVPVGTGPAPVPAGPFSLPAMAAGQDRQAAPSALAPAAFSPVGASPGPPRRWSAAAWLFIRDGSGGALLPGGSLGGSQAGLRATYRLNGDSRRSLSLSARFYSALERPRGAEAAVGVDWRPIARLPIHLLAERRERLGLSGRSDWQLTAYGGFELRRRRMHVESYAQAGLVGLDHPDLFADGAARAGIAAGPFEVGGGAWGGAQPGAARLDVGPHVSARLRIGGATLRADADWRFRIAGDAAPGSGPAFTLSAGF